MSIIQSRSGFRQILENISIVAAITVFFASTVIIIGWVFNIPVLKSLRPDFVSMKANTAICFFFVGSTILLMHAPLLRGIKLKINPGVISRLILFFPVVAIVIAGLTMIQYIFNIHIGIDELFFWMTLMLLPPMPRVAWHQTLHLDCFCFQ